jgi:hypothetical protein
MKLDKRGLKEFGDMQTLYINMVSSLLNELISDGYIDIDDDIELIASQMYTNTKAKERFISAVENDTKAANLHVRIAKPSEERCLQAVDFISWAYWRKYEKEDPEYANIVAESTIREYDYDWHSPHFLRLDLFC